MNTCGSCKHWKRPEERKGFGNAVSYRGDKWDDEEGSYSKADRDDKLFGECKEIDLGYELPVDSEPPLAVTRDGSDYRATLYTQAEFGCVLWKEKDEPNLD